MRRGCLEFAQTEISVHLNQAGVLQADFFHKVLNLQFLPGGCSSCQLDNVATHKQDNLIAVGPERRTRFLVLLSSRLESAFSGLRSLLSRLDCVLCVTCKFQGVARRAGIRFLFGMFLDKTQMPSSFYICGGWHVRAGKVRDWFALNGNDISHTFMLASASHVYRSLCLRLCP